MTSEFAINTYSYTQSMSAADCVRHVAGLGARRVELMTFPGHVWIDASDKELNEITRVAAGEGVGFCSVNTTNIDINIAGAAPEMREYSIRMVSEFIRIAGHIGAPAFILGVGKANPLFPLPKTRMRSYFFEALDQLLPVARQSGVEIWAENMPFCFLPDLDGLLAALDSYGADEIGVCYDVANAHFIGENPADGIRRLGARLKLLHLSDTNRQVYRHAAIGEGDVDFGAVGRVLKDAPLSSLPVLELISSNADFDFQQAPKALAEKGFHHAG